MGTAKVLALIMVVTTMLSGGLQVNRDHVVETVRRYHLLLKALLANFVLLPAFAWCVLRAFNVDAGVATGILLMTVSPGVPFLVNSAARKQGGSLAFALEIAFLFSLISVVTIPFSAELLFPNHEARVPMTAFILTLIAFQLVPLIVGAVAGPRLPEATIEKLVRFLHIVFLAAAVVLIVVIWPKLTASLASTYGYGHLAIIALIGLFALAIGWLLGGPERPYRRTLAIATCMRNIGLAVLIGTDYFDDTLVVPTVISYFVITFALSLPVRAYFRRTREVAPA